LRQLAIFDHFYAFPQKSQKASPEPKTKEPDPKIRFFINKLSTTPIFVKPWQAV